MWLLDNSAMQSMREARAVGVAPTAEQQLEYSARISGADSGDHSRIMSVAGDKAEIKIKGVLTKTPDFMSMLFGGGNTTYSDINAALAVASSDPSISSINLLVDSPGGHINGLFDTIAALQTTSKALTCTVDGTCASAAYAIASQADKIEATNKASSVGSIGIVVDAFIDEDRVSITSTNAPNKRPDLSTEEGKAVLVEELDAIHELFVDAIATGRGKTEKEVNATFGRGSMVLANEAIKRGMIDGIAGANLRVVESSQKQNARGGDNNLESSMDITQLEATHPQLFAAVIKQGEAQGVESERDRVSSHLVMGSTSGDMKTAIEAIKDGSGMTATLQATYMSAGMNRADINARGVEDLTANAGDNANKELEQDAGEGAEVLAILQENLGMEV